MEATAAFGKKYECADPKARKRFDVMKFVGCHFKNHLGPGCEIQQAIDSVSTSATATIPEDEWEVVQPYLRRFDQMLFRIESVVRASRMIPRLPIR